MELVEPNWSEADRAAAAATPAVGVHLQDDVCGVPGLCNGAWSHGPHKRRRRWLGVVGDIGPHERAAAVGRRAFAVGTRTFAVRKHAAPRGDVCATSAAALAVGRSRARSCTVAAPRRHPCPRRRHRGRKPRQQQHLRHERRKRNHRAVDVRRAFVPSGRIRAIDRKVDVVIGGAVGAFGARHVVRHDDDLSTVQRAQPSAVAARHGARTVRAAGPSAFAHAAARPVVAAHAFAMVTAVHITHCTSLHARAHACVHGCRHACS
eukprot:359153-Chlamydomonas_euryale.AAC.8